MFMFLLVLSPANAFDPPPDAALINKAVTMLKEASHRSDPLPGFTMFWSTPDCYAMYASTLVALEVDAVGHKTLRVIVNNVNTRGGFVFRSFIDSGADGTLDEIETLPAESQDYVGYSQMFHDALLCYTHQ